MTAGSQGERPVILLLLLCTLGPSVSQAGKLLVVPVDGSHWLSLVGPLQPLQQRGHDIMVLAPDASVYINTRRRPTTTSTHTQACTHKHTTRTNFLSEEQYIETFPPTPTAHPVPPPFFPFLQKQVTTLQRTVRTFENKRDL